MTPALCDVEPFVVTFEDLKMELSEDENSLRDFSEIDTVLHRMTSRNIQMLKFFGKIVHCPKPSMFFLCTPH